MSPSESSRRRALPFALAVRLDVAGDVEGDGVGVAPSEARDERVGAVPRAELRPALVLAVLGEPEQVAFAVADADHAPRRDAGAVGGPVDGVEHDVAARAGFGVAAR